jgi:hypothetical protein
MATNSMPRKAANVNVNNARGKVVPGAQHVNPAKKVAGASDKSAYTRKSTNLSASNLPMSTADHDGQTNVPR